MDTPFHAVDAEVAFNLGIPGENGLPKISKCHKIY